MAPKNSTRVALKGSKNPKLARPSNPPLALVDTVFAKVPLVVQTYKGSSWRSIVTSSKLDSLRQEYNASNRGP